MKIVYSKTQLEQAARFVWNNNAYIVNWPSKPSCVEDVIATITETMLEVARLNANWFQTGTDSWIANHHTGGFYLLFARRGEEFIDVEITVDPALGINPHDERWIVEYVGDSHDNVVPFRRRGADGVH